MVAALSAWPAAHAQTLGEMIDQAKWARRMQPPGTLAGSVPPVAMARPAASAPTPPLLWSLQGMAGQFEAVLIHGGRAHVVRSDDTDSWRVGPWRVARLDETGLLLTAAQGRAKPAVRLLPPVPGASARPHLRRLTAASPSPASAPPASPQTLSAAQMQAAQLPTPVPPHVLPAAPAAPSE